MPYFGLPCFAKGKEPCRCPEKVLTLFSLVEKKAAKGCLAISELEKRIKNEATKGLKSQNPREGINKGGLLSAAGLTNTEASA